MAPKLSKCDLLTDRPAINLNQNSLGHINKRQSHGQCNGGGEGAKVEGTTQHLSNRAAVFSIK